VPHRPHHRVDVAMRPRRDDLQALAGWHEGLAAQRAAHQVDHRLGQMREVASVSFLTLPSARKLRRSRWLV